MNTDKIYAEAIANEYAVKDTRKVAYTFGVIAALILGVGMCLAMNVIGSGTTAMMVLGIIIGVVGIAGVSVNYPIYKKLLEKGKKKYAADIMYLAKEITEE